MIVVTIAALLATVSFASQGWTACNDAILDMNNLPKEMPQAVRVCRDGVIAISYDRTMINPAFSQYHITPEEASKLLPGRDAFYEDPDLQQMGVTQASVHSAAFSQEWNRGHLSPSHIMSYSKLTKHSCYTMANIAPQGGYFNQHPWAELEDSVVNWVRSNKALYIITGVMYKDRAHAQRTYDNIAVPDYYFKVLCDPVAGQSAGFYGVNEPTTTNTTNFVPVDQVAQMYGGQLFPSDKCNTQVVNRNYWW